MSVRQALADAASTVGGITVTPYYRLTTKPGQGFVRYDRTDYPDVFDGLTTWQVVITLPADAAEAERWLEAKKPDLITALAQELMIRQLAPRELATPPPENQRVPVVVIEGQRAEADE